ncbi:hypothetical protein AKJ41_05075 [candidate division MSBL1 archaeon SCGC-AAA259O05]|uniref:Uncharacterized protein n=1 Tax=candidate division MSBL1 archaeon SCGC-AAA259O05 TaxID=1698271 RepID=A0A133UZS2_9EURY|nr:hypothetical protein AKJ41_05075 [candidate division MSBL1 archaeon SCGC-AAA259O05]
MKKGGIENLTRKIGFSLSLIRSSAGKLGDAVSEVKKVALFRPENWIENVSSRFLDLHDDIGERNDQHLRRKFEKICDNFRFVYRFPKCQINRADQSLKAAGKFLENALVQFLNMLDLMDKISEENPLVQQLYDDFTRNGTPPGIAVQVELGTEEVLEEINLLKKRIQKMRKSLPPSDDFEKKFPSNFYSRFSSSLRDDNEKLARKILLEASNSASEASDDFVRVSDFPRKFDDLYLKLRDEYSIQMKEPEPNWENEYEDYPGPGDNLESGPKRKSVRKYVIYREEGTIVGIENVLESVRSDLKLLENLARRFESERKKLEKFELDEDLKEKLKKGRDFWVFENFTREEVYELSLPEPLKSDPGLSVYHEVEIDNVRFDREDPAGLIGGDSAPPTPIYLWFINGTLYWAQWNVEVEVEEPLVEEIFDYRNQTIPRPLVMGSWKYVHKALPNRQEFLQSEFTFRLIVFSLRPFGIS